MEALLILLGGAGGGGDKNKPVFWNISWQKSLMGEQGVPSWKGLGEGGKGLPPKLEAVLTKLRQMHLTLSTSPNTSPRENEDKEQRGALTNLNGPNQEVSEAAVKLVGVVREDSPVGVEAPLSSEALLELRDLMSHLGISHHSERLEKQRVSVQDLQRLKRSELKFDLGLSLGVQLKLMRWQNGDFPGDLPGNSLESLLTDIGLDGYLPQFEREEVDLQGLLFMSKEEMRALGLPLGPRTTLDIYLLEHVPARRELMLAAFGVGGTL